MEWELKTVFRYARSIGGNTGSVPVFPCFSFFPLRETLKGNFLWATHLGAGGEKPSAIRFADYFLFQHVMDEISQFGHPSLFCNVCRCQ